MIKKFPFAIVAGISAILAFYGIFAFVAVYIVNSGVAAQTSETVSMFASWWQVLLFVLDIVFVLGCLAMIALSIVQKKMYPRVDDEEDI